MDLTPDAVKALMQALPAMPSAEKQVLLAELEALDAARADENCRNDFRIFCKTLYNEWKEGPHHRHIAPLLHSVCHGSEKRLTVSMPPRFGKSESIAYMFVAWYLGHNPTHHIIMVTHTASLSADFGRKVRNLIDTPDYQRLFPKTKVSRDKSAADNWTTTAGGKYLAIGIGANVAGHGAHLLIADDLVSEQAIATNPDAMFANAWQYMQVGPLQRLMPDGRIVMIGCMTAETKVLMADETEKEIQHIQVGDVVATYDAGTIATSRITNWIKHPSDFIYKIRTTSGTIVRANKRHPFLVDRNGVRSWVRVRDLKVGDCFVKAAQQQGASDRIKLKGCAKTATSECCMPKDASEHSAVPEIGVSGERLNALLTGAPIQSPQKGCAAVVTASSLGVPASTALPSSKNARAISSTGTAFLWKLSTLCAKGREACVQFASALQSKKTQGLGKCQSCTSITATILEKSEGSCATTAIWPLDTQTQRQCYLKRLDTYATTPDAIVEIVEDGYEPVFDMEVERTENFIANGVVSHNTRWGKKDPIGRALAWAQDNPSSPQWNEVRFPAIMPSGKSLWPEQWPLDQLLSKKASMFPQFWAAQYMQEPTSEEGALIKREWWKQWDAKEAPSCDYIIMALDAAAESHNKADFTALLTWGVFRTDKETLGKSHIILLNAINVRVEFPELKDLALKEYKSWKPDAFIVEKKSSGTPLFQELRTLGIPVSEFTPHRGTGDKYARINAVADLFRSGMVWYPGGRIWAEAVVNQVAEFPNGENDDLVDCTSMALSRFRNGGFIRLESDEKEEDRTWRRKVAYY